MRKTYVVGITGGIASGKSAVSGILEKKGAYIIDADVVAREVAEPGGKCAAMLAEAFPEAFPEGVLDRRKLREEAFSDKQKLQKLNSITHPMIKAELARRIDGCAESVAFLVVPLMFETGCNSLCDYIVNVVSDEETRINRLKTRNNNITEELAREIMRSQLSENERVTRADEVIVNNDSLEKLEAKVNEFYSKIKCREK